MLCSGPNNCFSKETTMKPRQKHIQNPKQIEKPALSRAFSISTPQYEIN